MRSGRSAGVVTIAIAGAVATVAAIGWGTHPLGPGLYGDGAGYLSAAESLVRSGQLRVATAPYWSPDSLTPMRQWPPGFPVAIAIPLLAGLNVVTAAVVVQVVAAVFTMILAVCMLAEVASPAWGGVAAAAVLATPALLGNDLNVVSEPLYVACLAALVLVMTHRPREPLFAGLVAAGMVLIRFLGVAAVAAVGCWSVMQPGRPLQRIRRGVAAGAPGLIAYAAWVTYRRSTGTAPAGVINHEVVPILRAFAGAIGAWLAPWDGGPRALQVLTKLSIAAAAAGAAVLTAARSRPRDGRAAAPSLARSDGTSARARLLAAAGVLALSHLGVLLAARVLPWDAEFSPRTFAPVYFLFTLMGVVALASAWRGTAPVRSLAVAAGLCWFVGSLTASAQLLHEARTVGLDHARAEERTSPTMAWVRTHGAGAVLYSNEPAKIYFHLHRPARSLPWVATDDTLDHVGASLSRRPGYVVWFSAGQAKSYLPPALLPRGLTLARLRAGAHLEPVATLADGVVLAPDATAPPAAPGSPVETLVSRP